MGVPAELLGKQVRCPHCKQVVLAPLNVAPSGVVPAVSPPPPLSMVGPNAHTQAISQSGAPPEPELPTFALQRREGADSILSGPEESEDEVFSQPGGGRAPYVPPLDLTDPPLAPTRPTLPDDNPFEIAGTSVSATTGPVPPSGPAATSELPNPFLELEPVTLPAAFQPPGAPPLFPPAPPRAVFPTPAAFPAAPPLPAPVANPFAGIDDPTILPGPAPVTAPVASSDAATESADDPPRKRRKSRREEEDAPKPEEKPQRGTRSRAPLPAARGGAGNVLLFIAIGYAVLVTGLAAWALFIKPDKAPPGHPLELIPDNFGEFDPAQRKKVSQYRFNVDGDLPAAQRAALGATVTVGQLEVTPVKVERRQLVIEKQLVKGGKEAESTKAEALVLTVSIKNTSDLTFHPMDPAFTRRANEGKKDYPITRVVVDKKRFYSGGTIDWPIDPNKFQRVYETQQVHDAIPLRPGETREYVVFTDAKNPQVLRAVAEAREPVQWRVEVRRAPAEVNGKEVPVTAIVGVDFRPGDVRAAVLAPAPQ